MQHWQLEDGETLRVKNKALSIEDVGKLVSSIEENDSITCIDIRERGLNDESCGLLMAAALRCSRLRRLHLSGNLIGDVGAQNLAVNLQALSSVLMHLDLSQNRLGPSCCKDLASSFFQQSISPTQPKELTLDLSDNALQDQGVVAIVNALSRAASDNIKLKVRLILRQVFCTDQGLMTLASVLQSLVGLHVAYNPISAVSLNSMCKVLTEQIVNKKNNRLRELDLSSLQCLDRGSRAGDAEGKSLLQRFDALSSMLVKTSAIREFVFAGNFLGDVGAQKIANGISENKYHNLERLGLSSNEIGKIGVVAVCGAMRKMADNGMGLRVLELDSNRLDDECARILGDAVSWSPNLARLLLSRNSIGDSGGVEIANGIARQLANAASKPPRGDGWPGFLIELDLDFNAEIADKAGAALADAVTSRFVANASPFCHPWGLERLRVVGTRIGEGRAEHGAERLAKAVQHRQELANEAVEAIQQNAQAWAKVGWVPASLKVFGVDFERFGVEKKAVAKRRQSYRALRRKWPEEGRERLMALINAAGETLLEGRHPVWTGERLRAAKRPRPRRSKAKQRNESPSSSSTCEDGDRPPWQPPHQEQRCDQAQIDELSASEHRRRLSESSGHSWEDGKQVFAYLPCQDVTTVTEAPKVAEGRKSGVFDLPRKSLASFVGGISSLFGGQQPEVLDMHDDLGDEEVIDAVGDWFEDDSDLGPRVQHFVDHTEQYHGPSSMHRGRRQRQVPADIVEGCNNTPSTVSSICNSAIGSSDYGSAVGSTTAPSSSRGDALALGVGSESRRAPSREDVRGDEFLMQDNLGVNFGSGGRDARESGSRLDLGDGPGPNSSRSGIRFGDGREERDLRCADGNLGIGSGVGTSGRRPLTSAGVGFGDGSVEVGVRFSGRKANLGLDQGGISNGDGREERDLRLEVANCDLGPQLGNDSSARESSTGDASARSAGQTSENITIHGADSGGGRNGAYAEEIERLRLELSKARDSGEVEQLRAALHAAEAKALETEKLKADQSLLSKQLHEREAELEALRAQLVVAKASASPKAGPNDVATQAVPKDSAAKADTPASPPPKAGTTKGKGVGKGPPPAKAKPKGAPPPKGGKAKAAAPDQASAKAKANMSKASAAETPFGRKIHLKPMYELGEACVWGELTGQGERQTEFRPELLAALFAQQQSEQKPKARWSAGASKKIGVSVLDGKRAQSMAIVLGRLPCSTEELCEALMTCNFGVAALSVDDIELVQGVLPTDDEIALLKHFQDKPEELRDIEQKVMPFCSVEKGVVRLNIMRVAVTHCASHKKLSRELSVVKKACEEVGRSDGFRKLLKTILDMGNYINAAKCQDSSMKGFAIDSLPALCTFKTGQVSSLHFLCLTHSKDAMFLRDLRADLSKVPEAARLKLDHLEGQVNLFIKDRVFVEGQVKALTSQEGHQRLVALGVELEDEEKGLLSELAATQTAADEVQKLFGVAAIKGSTKMPPIEEFMDHIAKFLEQLATAWNEIERNPAKWQKFEKSEKQHDRDGTEADSTRKQSGDAAETALGANDTPSEGSNSRVARVRPRLSIKRAVPKLRSDSEKDPSAVDSTTGLISRSPAGSDLASTATISRTVQRVGTASVELAHPSKNSSETPPLLPRSKTASMQAGLENEDDASAANRSLAKAQDETHGSLAASNCFSGKEVEATDSSTTAPPVGNGSAFAVAMENGVEATTRQATDEASLATSCVEETIADLRSGGISVSGALKTSTAIPPRVEDLEPFSGNDPSLLTSNDDTDSIGPWDSASQVAVATPWPRNDTHAPSPEITEAIASIATVPPREVGDIAVLNTTVEASDTRTRSALPALQEPQRQDDLQKVQMPSTAQAASRPARGIGTLAAAAAARAGHHVTAESKPTHAEELQVVPLLTAPKEDSKPVKGKGIPNKGKGKGKKSAASSEAEAPDASHGKGKGKKSAASSKAEAPDAPHGKGKGKKSAACSEAEAPDTSHGHAVRATDDETTLPTMLELQHRNSFVVALDKRYQIVAEAESSLADSNSSKTLVDKPTPEAPKEIVMTEHTIPEIHKSPDMSNEPNANTEHSAVKSSQPSQSQAELSSEEEF